MLLPILQACAQPAQSPPEDIPPAGVTVGQPCPDVLITNILNYPGKEARISDFRGKLLILDFFATWCGSCIAALPALDTLQKQWGDKIQVLVVDYEPAAKVKAFLDINHTARQVNLPFVTQDSLLSKLFPHRLIPHDVWIGPQGRVSAITQAAYVNDRNIRLLLSGLPLHLPLKKDAMNFDRSKPLLVNGNGGGAENVMYRSLFTKHLDGLFSGSGRVYSADSSRVRTYYINQPILALYASATGNYFSNRILLEVADTGRYICSNEFWNDWSRQHCYCYEITAPRGTPGEKIRELMLQDLNRYLELRGRMEKRRVSCFALVRNGKNGDLLQTKGGKPASNLFDRQTPVKVLHNLPLSRLIRALNYQPQGQPILPVVIDETGYQGKVDLKLKVRDIRNLKELQKALVPYGLKLEPVQRQLEMFVLSEDMPPNRQEEVGP